MNRFIANFLLASAIAFDGMLALSVDLPKVDVSWKFKIQNVLNANDVTFVDSSGSITLNPTGRVISGSFPAGAPGRYYFQHCSTNFLLDFGNNTIEDAFEFADGSATIIWFGWERHRALSIYRAATNDPRFLGPPAGYLVVDGEVLRTMLNLTNFESRSDDGRVRLAEFKADWDLPNTFSAQWRLGTTTSVQDPLLRYNVILESFAIAIPTP